MIPLGYVDCVPGVSCPIPNDPIVTAPFPTTVEPSSESII